MKTAAHTFGLNPRGFWCESERCFFFFRTDRAQFAVCLESRDADHRELELVPDGARITIASGLRLHKTTPIISPEEGET